MAPVEFKKLSNLGSLLGSRPQESMEILKAVTLAFLAYLRKYIGLEILYTSNPIHRFQMEKLRGQV